MQVPYQAGAHGTPATAPAGTPAKLNPVAPTWLCEGYNGAELAQCLANANDPSMWLGAQATVQRWHPDPLKDNAGKDRTIRTVFTHDHFSPSTHQQAGLYAGLLVEPKDSTWKDSETGEAFYTRADGGPTSWQAIITNPNAASSYREFALEFQDFQLAYKQGDQSFPIRKMRPLTRRSARRRRSTD